MGQPMPLPERIPRPSDEVATAFTECGIVCDLNTSDKYVTYTLPEGWSIVDDSYREDLPIFHIIDAANMIRFSVSGAWKGTYDNILHINKVKEPYEFKRREEKLIPSKTNDVALFIAANNKNPDEIISVRQPDYMSAKM